MRGFYEEEYVGEACMKFLLYILLLRRQSREVPSPYFTFKGGRLHCGHSESMTHVCFLELVDARLVSDSSLRKLKAKKVAQASHGFNIVCDVYSPLQYWTHDSRIL